GLTYRRWAATRTHYRGRAGARRAGTNCAWYGCRSCEDGPAHQNEAPGRTVFFPGAVRCCSFVRRSDLGEGPGGAVVAFRKVVGLLVASERTGRAVPG